LIGGSELVSYRRIFSIYFGLLLATMLICIVLVGYLYPISVSEMALFFPGAFLGWWMSASEAEIGFVFVHVPFGWLVYFIALLVGVQLRTPKAHRRWLVGYVLILLLNVVGMFPTWG